MSSTGRALREEGSWMLSTGWYMSLYHPVSPPLNEAHFRDRKLFLLSLHSTYLLFSLLTAHAGASPAGVFFNTRRSAERLSNGEGVGMLSCAPCLSSYQRHPTRRASSVTLHLSRIKPLPCSVTDQEGPVLNAFQNLTPRHPAQCVGITDPMTTR